MHNIVPVILCGGSGTRLWPLSRAGFPKQFLVFSGSNTLFQQAVTRLNHLCADDIYVGGTLVVTNEEHRFLVLDQLREMPDINASLLLEPVGRNTAPALTMAALRAIQDGSDPILVVSPADQAVNDAMAFQRSLQSAVRAAADGAVVVLGVEPTSPETGYGYIKQASAAGAHHAHAVVAFAEKPDSATAIQYLESGEYTWNSGIFVLRASTWLAAIELHRPDIHQAVKAAWEKRSQDGSFVRLQKELFEAIPGESIDYAVMEKCPGTHVGVKMVSLNAGWSDLGAWDAVWKAVPVDENGNAIKGDAIVVDTANTLVHSTSRLVGTVGVRDLVIVETADAVLVADRACSQDVKMIVAALGEQSRAEHALHRKVFRPWGWYDSVDEDMRFKVKRIQVKPGAKLSLQKHHHRAEHWIVVKGTAEVTCGDKVTLLTENQSTYIPLGEVHRLANPGTIPLEIIEVQSGSYLGEDDIVRFEDNYGRSH